MGATRKERKLNMKNSTTTSLKRMAMLAAVASFAMTLSQPSMATSANPTKSPTAVSANAKTESLTDVSSRDRRRVRRGGGNGGAAAAAAIAGIAGAAIIGSQNRGYNDGYYGRRRGYYGGGPRYYRRGYGY